MSEEKPKKKPKKRKQVYQRHHIIYGEVPAKDWVVEVTRGEHFLITQLQRFGSLSHGAVQALFFEIANKPLRPRAED